ncbi:LOW QUALITY PROTEIN: hypothetical protein U9M48_000271 [Paspalum notatum var. saurae]|uniref:Uncharacterized protein n=1 Tax=Paspalum notatum var. saurae TaxID=547442 RepID=A0AAQ3PGL9_PASNO
MKINLLKRGDCRKDTGPNSVGGGAAPGVRAGGGAPIPPRRLGELAMVDPELPSLVSVVQCKRPAPGSATTSTAPSGLFPLRLRQLLRGPGHLPPRRHGPRRRARHRRSPRREPRPPLLRCPAPQALPLHRRRDQGPPRRASQESIILEASRRTTSAAINSNDDEPWRRKLRSLVPAEGVVVKVKHIRTEEPAGGAVAADAGRVPAHDRDQYMDKLFANDDGRLQFHGNNVQGAMSCLWMNSMSRLAALYCLIARDVELDKLTGGSDNISRSTAGEEEEDASSLELVIPPVFDHCTVVLDPEEQRAVRDLYWQRRRGRRRDTGGGAACSGRASIARNPFVGEPHLVLAQALLNAGMYEEADRGLRLILEWGSSWDKRVVSWEGWVAWGRMMRDKAKEEEWPTTAFGVIGLGLGLVQGVKQAPKPNNN